MGWTMIFIGGIVTAIGIALVLLERAGFRGLPGDVFFQRGNVTFFFPIATCIVVSVILTIVFNLWKK